MDKSQMIEKLKTMLTQHRFAHSMGVMHTAVKLAQFYDADVEKAQIAGLLHDCAKDFPKDKVVETCEKLGIELDDVKREQIGLIHSDLGAKLAQTEFGIEDPDIISAIKYHTLGRANMTKLEEIIYLADFIEPTRQLFPGLSELREIAYQDLDQAMLFAIDLAIAGVVRKNKVLHSQTIVTKNYFDTLLSKERVGI